MVLTDTTTSAQLTPHCCFRGTSERPSNGCAHARLGRIALVGSLPRLAPAFHGSERLSQRRAQSLPGLDRHDKVERSPAAQVPPDTRLYRCQSRSGYLEPDATLIGGSGENRFAVLVEYDRTDRPHKQIDRLRRYDWWLLEGWRETHFATHASPPTVVFLTSRERPLRRLVETADQVLSAWYGREDAGPREGTHPARERILFTSRERIGQLVMELYGHPSEAGARARLLAAWDAQTGPVPLSGARREERAS